MYRRSGIGICCPRNLSGTGSWHWTCHWSICLWALWTWYCYGACSRSQVEAFHQETTGSTKTTSNTRSLTWSHHPSTLPGHGVYHDDMPHLQLPPATSYGWKKEGDRLVPIPTKDLPAPVAVTHLIKCGCKKTSCRSHCSCRSQHLNCSECVRVELTKICAVTSVRHYWGSKRMKKTEIFPSNQERIQWL